MTPISLSELESLERSATPGPWELCPESEYVFAGGDMVAEMRGIGAFLNTELNGKLISASRNALPELIASLRIAVKALGECACDCDVTILNLHSFTSKMCQGCRAMEEIQKRVTL